MAVETIARMIIQTIQAGVVVYAGGVNVATRNYKMREGTRAK